MFGGQNAVHISSHPRQVSKGGQQGQGTARWMECQNEVAMTTGPLGESFRGLQGVEADLRSEAQVYVPVGWESVRGGRGEGLASAS